MLASDPTLRRWYLRFNDLYFESKLPYDITIFWEPSNGNLGETFEYEAPDGATPPEIGIRIDPSIRALKTVAKMTVLHECCHVKLYPDLSHGKRFQNEMKRLANMDAFKKLW